jgi:4Fe-4S binding domain
MRYNLAYVGNWLARHQKLIRLMQWTIILIYACLILIPVFLPLPDESARLFHHLTLFAGFLFWGIWWPFVLISIIFFGRLWCGVLCPEGALSEFSNRHGREKSIPKWIRWGGWPFVAFGITTLYGQMISVYQYPKPVLLILGGSTLAAMVVGFLYGKSSRVWCKYLCPVTGVFNLLARLSPWRYQPLPEPWNTNQVQQINNVRCPTLLPLPQMTGAANCLMCGKCGIAKNSIQLTMRSPNEEIVVHGGKKNSFFDSLLILYGLCGLALGAFQWTNSFWFAHYRDVIDSWFLAHQLTGIFNTHVPWWIFTHYPERGDVFTWMYGFEVIAYILLVGFAIGAILTALISLSVKITGQLTLSRFNHLSQSLIPLGACSVFIGLSANTTSMLQKYANLGFMWVNDLKCILLFLATLWSFLLAYKIIRRYTHSFFRQMFSLFIMLINFAMINYSWILVLYIWSLKSDSIPWNALWVFKL